DVDVFAERRQRVAGRRDDERVAPAGRLAPAHRPRTLFLRAHLLVLQQLLACDSSSCVAIVCSSCTCSSSVGSGMPAVGCAAGAATETVGGVCCSDGGAWSSRYGTTTVRSFCGALRLASMIRSTITITLRWPIDDQVRAFFRFFVWYSRTCRRCSSSFPSRAKSSGGIVMVLTRPPPSCPRRSSVPARSASSSGDAVCRLSRPWHGTALPDGS